MSELLELHHLCVLSDLLDLSDLLVLSLMLHLSPLSVVSELSILAQAGDSVRFIPIILDLNSYYEILWVNNPQFAKARVQLIWGNSALMMKG